ncbi:TlpA family protein disulfide reductase [Umezawaea tangerina]|uniref:Thioredoxin domain-containing protein n=1 Tax=Umezawaea tangerina TaxID=84725 RepID=A0A2T0T7D4_9PSEU|nr:hypothetical protein [Umezawaea tangerina]PRY41532.1 hypothetical protein CLV43_105290 [Umezawaea tangerina]
MFVLTAAVVLLGALCALDLLLTFGVVRRLREHTATLEDLLNRGGAAPMGPAIAGDLPAAGKEVGPFAATTVDGAPVSRELLPANHVAVFLTSDCPSCKDQVPALRSWAAAQDRARTVVVVDGRLADPAELVAALSPVATVVVESVDIPVTEAYGVHAFPSFAVVADGRVTYSSLDFFRLPVAA